MHRLSWSTTEIRSFVKGSLRAAAGNWVVGAAGAVARFAIGSDEASEVEQEGSRIVAWTENGAIRFEVTDRVRALALRPTAGSVNFELIILAVPRSQSRPQPHAGLTPLGADHAAIRAVDRSERLYDLGINSAAAAFCVRTEAPDLVAELDRRAGQSWGDVLAAQGDRIVRQSPTRVVRSDVARIEVFAPIPQPGEQAPAGPQTHFLPDLLALGRETVPGLDVPASFVPCALFYPASVPAISSLDLNSGEPARLVHSAVSSAGSMVRGV